MGNIYDAMTRFFKEDAWPATEIPDQTAMSMNFQGKSGRWGCLARVDEEKELVLFYSYVPVKVEPGQRPIMADFLTRANYGLYIGNFEMDYNDGEVRYKTSVDVEGNASRWKVGDHETLHSGDELPMSFALMKRMVYDNVGVMDKYMPGIMAVVYGGASPTEAISKVEG